MGAMPPDVKAKALPELLLTNEPHPEQAKWVYAARYYRRVMIAVGRQAGKSSSRRFFYLDKMNHTPGFIQMAYMSHGHMPAESAFSKDLDDFSKAGMVVGDKNKDQLRYIDLRGIRCTNPSCNHPAHAKYGRNIPGEGARIFYWSGDPDAHQRCQGEALHFAILDECSHLPEGALKETIIPMFNTTRGTLVLMGSPIPEGIGFEWFGREWSLGDPANPKREPLMLSFNSPSESNPYGDPATIRDGRRSCRSRAEELCLYDGKFVTDIGAVFQNLDAVFVLPKRESSGVVNDYTTMYRCIFRPPSKNESTIVSIDWARDEDFTWVDCFSKDTMEQLGFLWMRRMDYHAQFPHVHQFIEWAGRPSIWADARDGGSTISEALRLRYGESAHAIKWTNGGKFDKQACVLKGVDLFQRGAWRLIDDETQREQFRLYAKTKMASGGFKYEAPKGVADDAVTAALYATYAMRDEARGIVDPKQPEVTKAAWDRFMSRSATVLRPNPFALRRR